MDATLEKIEVKGLFGYLSYELDQLSKHRSTFIIGNNGTGKTTLFRLVSDLINGRWHSFHAIRYDEISFEFLVENSVLKLAFKRSDNSVFWKDGSKWEALGGSYADLSDQGSLREKAQWISDNHSEVGVASCGRHWTIPGDSHVDDEELVSFWEDEIAAGVVSVAQSEKTSTPDLSKLSGLSVHFIQSDRLASLPKKRTQRNRYVHQYPSANDESPIQLVRKEIRDLVTQRISRAYVQRDQIGNQQLNNWLKQSTPASVTEEDVRILAEKLEKAESSLEKFLPSRSPTKLALPKSLPVGSESFLGFYLSSRLKQLETLDDFVEDAELFLQLCNGALNYKRISINQVKGLFAEQVDGGPISLDDLSSGEKQLIYLAYQMIFIPKGGSLILIDEPELSLHIVWQREFKDMLDRISEAKGCVFLAATHSPSIVGDHTQALRPIEVKE